MNRIIISALLLFVPGFAMDMTVPRLRVLQSSLTTADRPAPVSGEAVAKTEAEERRRDVDDFIEAVRRNDKVNVQRFIDQGGNINGHEFCGTTALLIAAFWGHNDIMNLLLDSGADVNLTNDCGSTVLHWAVSGRNIEAIRSLCKRSDIRPSLNAVDIRGETPHSMAVRTDQTDMAQIIKDATQWSLIKGIPMDNNSPNNG